MERRLEEAVTRRGALSRFANGFGMLGLAGVLADQAKGDAPSGDAPAADKTLAVKRPHFPAKAKRLIFLFMSGGPSHVDTFDPKPELAKRNGQPLPFEMPKLVRTKTGNLLASPWKFAKHGQSGVEMSELWPHLAKRADDLCVIRSMVADNINHNGACLQMNTGEQAFSRPALGSWLLYGLGTENQDLPGYVVISPAQPAQGAPLWSSSFLPAAYQGTLVSNLKSPIEDLAKGSLDRQRKELDLLQQLNGMHRAGRPGDDALDARIASFELAFRMQREAPAAFSTDDESKETHKLYGIDEPTSEIFGRQCLMARKLVERGVRTVQVYHTQTSKRSSCQLWDQHGGLRNELTNNCAAVDKPIAGLLADLKARGLLEDTIVLWGGEFGRTPTAEGNDGREHHPFGFSMWLAGAGIKGGMTYGATDDFGWHAVDRRVHVHDLHATLLHLLGLDHEKLTFRYSGRDFRLTDVHGRIVSDILI